MDFWKSRSAKSTPTWAIAAVLLLVGIGGVLAFDPSLLGFVPTASVVNPNNNNPNNTNNNGPMCQSGYRAPSNYLCVTSATLSFALNDPLATGAIASAIVTVYNPDGTGGSDSGSTSASGVYTTNGKYNTGQQLVALISKANYVTYFQALTVPPALNSASPPTNLQVPLFDTSLGSWSNQVTGNPGGTTFSTAQTYYFSGQATPQTSLQLQWTLTETTNNAGYPSSYDIFNHFTRSLVFVASDGGDGIQSITNYQQKEIGGTTNYYLFTIPSGVTTTYAQDGVSLTGWTVSPTGATQYTNTNSQTSTGGVYVFTFNVNRNSEAVGTTATWSFKLWYAASATFSPNGAFNLGPPATQSGSTFTIKFTA